MSHPRRWRIDATARAAGSLVLLAVTGGCYTYRPVEVPGPEVGAQVSAELSRDGSSAMTPVLGPDVASVNGKVVEASADTLRLSLVSVTNQRGIPTSWRGELVPVPRAGVNNLGQRRLATGGTALLSVGITAGLYVLYRLIGGPSIIEGSGGTGGGGGQ